jgi:hypothetical protein
MRIIIRVIIFALHSFPWECTKHKPASFVEVGESFVVAKPKQGRRFPALSKQPQKGKENMGLELGQFYAGLTHKMANP